MRVGNVKEIVFSKDPKQMNWLREEFPYAEVKCPPEFSAEVQNEKDGDVLLEVDPQFGIHKAVKSFKGYTSRILRQEFPYLKTKMPTLWTNSYFVSTVGGAPLEAVKQYIENQKTSQRQKDKMG